jgi:hypothetical protein
LALLHAPRVFVFPEQLAVLIKYVVQNSSGTRWPADFEDAFTQALLIVSDLRLKRVGAAATTAASFLPVEIAGMFGFEDPYVNKLLIYATFFKWTHTDGARSLAAFTNVTDEFEKRFKIHWLDFMSAGYGLLMWYKQISTLDILSKYSFILSPQALDQYKDQGNIRRFLELNKIELENLSKELGQRWAYSNLGSSLFPLKQRPFVELSGNRLCCPYVQFLENASTSGLFYRLADSYQAEDAKKSRSLRAFFGQFLEQYVFSIFERISYKCGYQIHGDKTYRVGKKERHGADVVFFDGHNVAFIEVTATRFREIDSLVELRDEFIEEDVERLVAKVRELNEDIRDFRSGSLTYVGVDPASVARTFPLLVTSFAVPHFVGIISIIREAIEREKLLENTESLEIAEVQALDLLEHDLVSTISIFDLLSIKQKRTAGRPVSLMNFVALRGREVGLDPAIPKPQPLLDIENELRDRFNSWGGPQIVPP